MTLNKEYEEACKLWKMAYESNEEELKFMISQRLSAINAEYDLLNEELENRKEKLRMRGIYNVLLIVVIVVLVVTYIIKESYRKTFGLISGCFSKKSFKVGMRSFES